MIESCKYTVEPAIYPTKYTHAVYLIQSVAYINQTVPVNMPLNARTDSEPKGIYGTGTTGDDLHRCQIADALHPITGPPPRFHIMGVQ